MDAKRKNPSVPVAHVVETAPSVVHRDPKNAPIKNDLSKMFKRKNERTDGRC